MKLEKYVAWEFMFLLLIVGIAIYRPTPPPEVIVLVKGAARVAGESVQAILAALR